MSTARASLPDRGRVSIMALGSRFGKIIETERLVEVATARLVSRFGLGLDKSNALPLVLQFEEPSCRKAEQEQSSKANRPVTHHDHNCPKTDHDT